MLIDELLPVVYDRRTVRTLDQLEAALWRGWNALVDRWIEEKSSELQARIPERLLSRSAWMVRDYIAECFNWDWEMPDDEDAAALAQYAAYGMAAIRWQIALWDGSFQNLEIDRAALREWLQKHQQPQMRLF